MYGTFGLRLWRNLHKQMHRRSPKFFIKNSRDEVVGMVAQAHLKKQKLAATSGAKVRFGILHGRGIDNSWSLFEVLKGEGRIKSGGAWYTYDWPVAAAEGQTEVVPVRWTGRHFGLGEQLAKNPELYAHLVQVYSECLGA